MRATKRHPSTPAKVAGALAVLLGVLLVYALGFQQSRPSSDAQSGAPFVGANFDVMPVRGDRLYPEGSLFPLGLYSFDVAEDEEMKGVARHGWNMAHTYDADQDGLLRRAAKNRVLALGHIDARQERNARRLIERMAAADSLAWWDLPEEQRYWKEEEFTMVQNLSQSVRKYDPRRRPIFMYLPGHYSAEQVARYVPFLDVIGAGAYTEYMDMPRAWVRYRIELLFAAIEAAGCKPGNNYLKGEKMPLAILMLFSGKNGKLITPQAAYHDFYCSLAAGARGVLVFSYFHRNDHPQLRRTFEMYNKAASEVSGPEGLGQALLWGERVELACQVVRGPQSTAAFMANEKRLTYPSVNARALKWNGDLYIIAVNSSEESQPVEVLLKGLPRDCRSVRVLFEDRSLAVESAELKDSFEPLQVHIYKSSP
jgi:hypothetical protein